MVRTMDVKYGTKNGELLCWVITMDPRLGDDEDRKVLMTASEILISTGPSVIIIDETEGGKFKNEVVSKDKLAERVRSGVTSCVRRIPAMVGG